METYAIWKDKNVIGYIDLTEDQRDVLNNIHGIGVYIGYDKQTAPELYMLDIVDKIDELKDKLTDIINNSESDNISLKRSEVLDSMYFETESKIHELEMELQQLKELKNNTDEM